MLTKKEIMLTRINRLRRIIKLMEEILEEDLYHPIYEGIATNLKLLEATINQLEININDCA